MHHQEKLLVSLNSGFLSSGSTCMLLYLMHQHTHFGKSKFSVTWELSYVKLINIQGLVPSFNREFSLH